MAEYLWVVVLIDANAFSRAFFAVVTHSTNSANYVVSWISWARDAFVSKETDVTVVAGVSNVVCFASTDVSGFELDINELCFFSEDVFVLVYIKYSLADTIFIAFIGTVSNGDRVSV